MHRAGTTASGQRGRRGERDWAAACVTGGAARDRTPDARAAAPGHVASRLRPRSAMTRLARFRTKAKRIPQIGEEPTKTGPRLRDPAEPTKRNLALRDPVVARRCY